MPAGGDFAALVSKPQHWHVTLFHAARLGEARPDALTPGGGVDGSLECPSVRTKLLSGRFRLVPVDLSGVHSALGWSVVCSATASGVLIQRMVTYI